MEEAMLEGIGDGNVAGLKVGRGRPRGEMLGVPEKGGVVPLRPGRVLFWPGMVGKTPPRSEPPAPGAGMGKMVILLTPKKLERMSERRAEI